MLKNGKTIHLEKESKGQIAWRLLEEVHQLL